MLMNSITTEQEAILANALNEIYFLSEIEDVYHDESAFLENVVQLVDNNIKKQKNTFDANPEYSYRISSSHDLVTAFIDMYKSAFEAAEKLAFTINDKFGYSIDVVNVLWPYLLYQFGIENEPLSLYIGLGMAAAKIICDILAKKEEYRQEKLSNEQIKFICSSLKKLLIDAKSKTDNSDECAEIQECISVLDKMLNTKQ